MLDWCECLPDYFLQPGERLLVHGVRAVLVVEAWVQLPEVTLRRQRSQVRVSSKWMCVHA